MVEQTATQTPMADRIQHFWNALSEPHVRVMVEIRRDHEDGGAHWDVSTFGDDVAKALASATSARIAALEGALRAILKHGELGNVGTGGWSGNKPAGNPMSKDVWQFPRHMLPDIEAVLASTEAMKGE